MAEREQKEIFKRYTVYKSENECIALHEKASLIMSGRLIEYNQDGYISPDHGDTLYDRFGKTYQFQKDLNTKELKLVFISEPRRINKMSLGNSSGSSGRKRGNF